MTTFERTVREATGHRQHILMAILANRAFLAETEAFNMMLSREGKQGCD